MRAAVVPHYYGVTKLVKKFRPRPYLAQTQNQGKKTYLGSFATAEEAALRVAQIPTSMFSHSSGGYYGVSYRQRHKKPYQAQVRRDCQMHYLGSFATAEEAALCVASSPEGRSRVGRDHSNPVELAGEGEAPPPPPPPPPKTNRYAWWSPDEERLLHSAIAAVGLTKFRGTIGELKWEAVARLVGTRDARQCKRRWHSPSVAAKKSLQFEDHPTAPRPRQPKKKKTEPVPLAVVPMAVPALEDGAHLFGAEDVRVDDGSVAAPSFSVPGFTLKPNQDEIYDHYGLLAIETYDEGSDFVCAEKSALRFAVGSCFGPAFQFSKPLPPTRGANRLLRREAAIREHQAAVTDYMCKVYCY